MSLENGDKMHFQLLQRKLPGSCECLKGMWMGKERGHQELRLQSRPLFWWLCQLWQHLEILKKKKLSMFWHQKFWLNWSRISQAWTLEFPKKSPLEFLIWSRCLESLLYTEQGRQKWQAQVKDMLNITKIVPWSKREKWRPGTSTKSHTRWRIRSGLGKKRKGKREVWVRERQSWLGQTLWYSCGVGHRVYFFR